MLLCPDKVIIELLETLLKVTIGGKFSGRTEGKQLVEYVVDFYKFMLDGVGGVHVIRVYIF